MSRIARRVLLYWTGTCSCAYIAYMRDGKSYTSGHQPHFLTVKLPRDQDDLARAAIPDRDLQLRLIHMLMGGRSSNTQSNSTSSDSGNRRMHSGNSVCSDSVRLPPPKLCITNVAAK